jgi:hypothetical protein
VDLPMPNSVAVSSTEINKLCSVIPCARCLIRCVPSPFVVLDQHTPWSTAIIGQDRGVVYSV